MGDYMEHQSFGSRRDIDIQFDTLRRMIFISGRMNPTILVTGANGYIGNHLTRLLSEPIITWDYSRKADIPHCLSQPATRSLSGIRTIFHLADARLGDLNANNVLENVKKHSLFFDQLKSLPNIERVIFASSCSVYGVNPNPIDEDSPTLPTSAYAESKLATEKLLMASELPYIILRFGTAFGLSPNMREDLLINQLAIYAATHRIVEIFDPSSKRPYIHCRDFARALVKASEFEPGQILNVVGFNFSKQELMLKIRQVSPTPPRFSITPNRDPRNYFVKSARMQKLGFKPKIQLETGYLEMYHSFRQAAGVPT